MSTILLFTAIVSLITAYGILRHDDDVKARYGIMLIILSFLFCWFFVRSLEIK